MTAAMWVRITRSRCKANRSSGHRWPLKVVDVVCSEPEMACIHLLNSLVLDDVGLCRSGYVDYLVLDRTGYLSRLDLFNPTTVTGS